MNRPISLRQNILPQLIKNSEAAWRRRSYQEAIEILERGSRLAPTESRIWLYLGRCHGSRYDYAAAERCFEKAIRMEGWTTESYLKAGRYCLSFRGHEMAAGFFERALKRDENATEILAELARIYMRQGRLEEAAALAERASHVNSEFTPVLLIRARLHRLAGQLEDAETILRSFITRSELNGWVQAEGWYDLGLTLDRQGRYDEAMKAFLEAKSVKLPATAPRVSDWKAAKIDPKQQVAAIPAEVLRRWHSEANLFPRHRLALLCGHPRSGTTLLEQLLDSHPDIVSAEETPVFFDEALIPLAHGLSPEFFSLSTIMESATAERLQHSRENYFRCIERLLGRPVGEQLLVDKNPSLTFLISAFMRIFPEAKYLIAIRDPRDVCLSCFMQPLFPSDPLSMIYPSLEAAADQYISLMGSWQSIKAQMPCPFLEVRYEELTDDLEAVARRTLEFLGVPWNDRLLSFQQHTRAKLVRSPTYGAVKQPVSKGAVGRWRNYQKYFEPCFERLEPFVKAFGYS